MLRTVRCAWKTGRACSKDGWFHGPDGHKLPVPLCDDHWDALQDWTAANVIWREQQWAAFEKAIAENRRSIDALKAELLALIHRRDRLRDARERRIPPVVYVLQREDGLVKIGTTHNLFARLKAHGRDHGALRLFGTLPGGTYEERALHRRFAAHLAEGREWFHPHDEVMAFAEGLRD